MNETTKKILMGVGAVASLGVIAWLMTPTKSKRGVDDSDETDSGSESDVEARFEEELEELQDIQREANSHYLDFNYFLKIFEISMLFARTTYAKDKKVRLAERRAALADGNDKLYEEIALTMTQEEENLTNQKLMEILNSLNIDQQEFQQNTMYHSQTQEKVIQIMAVQKKAVGTFEPLTREKCLEVFQTQQKLQLEMIDDIVASGILNQQPTTPEAQTQQMIQTIVHQAKQSDKLFEATGVEEEQLMSSMEKLELEKDREFQQIMQESMLLAQQKASKAMGGQGGQAGAMGMGGMDMMGGAGMPY